MAGTSYASLNLRQTVIFLLGFFWKRTTARAALAAAWLTIPLSRLFKFLPEPTNGAIAPIPFLDRMSWVFVLLLLVMAVLTLADSESRTNPKGLTIDTKLFRVTPGSAVASVLICGILAGLYTVFW
ncbi:MAG: hypothetical protein LH606_11180 [Cytophagaceae bacterium]|nr:hypothetical protein [Cytophagaceae bacterium]